MQNVATATAAKSATHNRTRDLFRGLIGSSSTEEVVLIRFSLNYSLLQQLIASIPQCVANITMAMYAGKHFAFRILRKHLMYDIGMACKASALCHALIPRLNSDGFVEILQRECQGMIESVIGLGKQSSQVIMRKMAVVADRDMTMARILPRVIMPLHH